jgi:hypothetical protein
VRKTTHNGSSSSSLGMSKRLVYTMQSEGGHEPKSRTCLCFTKGSMEAPSSSTVPSHELKASPMSMLEAAGAITSRTELSANSKLARGGSSDPIRCCIRCVGQKDDRLQCVKVKFTCSTEVPS